MRFKPSAAAVYWFLMAQGEDGEASYENQEDLAEKINIPYGTVKDGLKELRARGLLDKTGKSIRLKKKVGVPG